MTHHLGSPVVRFTPGFPYKIANAKKGALMITWLQKQEVHVCVLVLAVEWYARLPEVALMTLSVAKNTCQHPTFAYPEP